ncbi:MAG: lysophospholipid acyltransferase family protein [Planctomycetota bacterium]|jgi:1-acyl-sn-glycerol-3-phosphate acyltransferase
MRCGLGRLFYRIAWVFCSAVMRVFFGLRTYGRGRIPRSGGVILAVNHASFIDPVVVGCGLTRPVHYMARATLFRGLFATLIRSLNAFPIARGGADRGAVKEFIRRARAGNVVMLFPEGTRTHDGRVGPIKPGVGALAIRAGAPVVPTYIGGTFDAWPRTRKLPRCVPLSIHFARPILMDERPGESKRKRQERIRSEIASRLRELEAAVLARRRRALPR